MRLNKRELPPIARDTSSAQYSSFALKNGDKTLTIYRCKSKKNVVILSTMHSNMFVDDSIKKNPNTVTYYNSTKCGIDVADQMLRKYSTSSGSRRWPVHVFYNVLDIAALNAWIIFKESLGTSISRREFILEARTTEQLPQNINTKNCAKSFKGQTKTVVSCGARNQLW
ncbi:uncharacterized protein LOC118203679 [Stegodyphus dumicola]|uniref:uncharacterized protein LOC118203679 n=1 Tax=Stegodyphus dumicola TaxID=202533 RepID=UPI0015B3145F|nr:uncharacterized protein LOC118203679 [Stegodyphus dumicola]